MDIPSEEVFDKAAALDRVDGDVELLAELAGLFLEDCPSLLQQIQEAVAASDSKKLAQAAHTLKGSVGNFCAKPATEAALRLEMMGRSGDLALAVPALMDLEKAMERLRPLLEALGARPVS
jgi:HPt (histidine-containing phosphotransfer) domain-containing protein